MPSAPRAERMPRALRALATAERLVAPDCRTASMMGKLFAAERSASTIWIWRPSWAAWLAFCGFPSLAPCALALGQCGPRPLRDEAAFLLGQGRIEWT
jgi:hypothetical protein